ncbi:MAG TPA: hypothetical protein VMU14_02820 [Acidimicrobiales bacterium]|nr:hypothetical protein [Acidimicrobiales bacterium]
MADNTMVYTAVYDDKAAALEDLKAIGQMHEQDLIGDYDAAVIDKEGGKPHIVKRADHPGIRVIPEAFGGGKLPRKELKDAATELTSGEAGLVVVGEVTLVKGLDKAFTRAVNVAQRNIDATTDEIASELKEALKG